MNIMKSNYFFLITLLFLLPFSIKGSVVETIVFADDFSGESLSGGSPATTYTMLKQIISEGSTMPTDAYYNSDQMMRVTAPKSSVTRNAVFGDLSVFAAPFNSKLSEIDADSVVWTFNLRANRSTTSGFGNGDFGVATILLADDANFATANGYAVVSYNVGGTRSYRLARFSNGLDSNDKFTDIVDGLVGNANIYPSFRITYIKSSNTWKFYARNDGSSFANPIEGDYTFSGSAVDDTFVNTSMSYFGFYIMCKSYTTDTNLDADNFTVRTYHDDVSNSNKDIQGLFKYYQIRHLTGAIEIKTESARTTLYSITGKTQQVKDIKDKATLKIDKKGLYILKIELPNGKVGVEKIFIQ